MAEVIKVTEQYVIAQANTIRQKDSTSDDLKKAAYKIGDEIGKKIIARYFLKEQTIITPEGFAVEATIPEIPLSVIVTTKDDLKYFGQGLAASLENCKQGYMNFEGRMGYEALNYPIREIELPLIKNAVVNTLVIGKAVLATGCTAISLTKTAMAHYMPNRLIIAAIFYTKPGLNDLRREFPNADLLVVGEPDELREDGMLIPGIGHLDKRIKGEK
jgi:uracil phosphoribosyltransferase